MFRRRLILRDHRDRPHDPTIVTWRVASCAALVTLATGCTPTWYANDADAEVEAILADFDQRVLGGRYEAVLHPEPLEEEGPAHDLTPPDPNADPDDLDAGTDAAAAGAPPPDPIPVDMAKALEIAFSTSRQYKDQQDSLYLSGLGYSLVRYNFGTILNSTISYVWNNGEDADASDNYGATLGASTILPSGGTLSADTDLFGSRVDDPSLFDLSQEGVYDSTVRFNLRQPLLRGAGYEVSHEPLTQSERNVMYSVRDFELFREDFSILVADGYLSLVSQKKQLVNDRQAYEDAVFDRKKTEALHQVDRNNHEDVILAQRRETERENQVLVAETNYSFAKDSYKILLGLPTATPIEILDHDPEFEPVRLRAGSAVEVALVNRLDLQTERDQLEDTARQVRIAKNSLLPDFDVALGYGFDGDGDTVLSAAPDEWSTSVGLTFEVPLDRKSERNAYRRSLIAMERAKRDWAQTQDEVERDVLNRLLELDEIEQRITLQQDQIKNDTRGVAVLSIRYEAGDVDARALLDARAGLTRAENQLIDLEADHFIARLRLRRDLGIFFVDANGMWTE